MIVYLVKGFPDLLDKPGGKSIERLFNNNTAIGTGNFQDDFVQVQVGDKTGWVSKNVLGINDQRLWMKRLLFANASS